MTVIDEGDELVPTTAPTERIAQMSVQAQPDQWFFIFAVDVHNTSDHPYELSLRALETQGGQTIRERKTQRWAPGDSARMKVQWTLPPGDLPVSMQVVGRLQVADDSTREQARRVHFGRIPVQMRE